MTSGNLVRCINTSSNLIRKLPQVIMALQSSRSLLLQLLCAGFTDLIEGVTRHACIPADLRGQPSINLVQLQPE